MEPDLEITNPRPSQFFKQAQGMWRVAYESKHGTSCPSAFISGIDPEGLWIRLTNGKRHWLIHPQHISKIQFFSKK